MATTNCSAMRAMTFYIPAPRCTTCCPATFDLVDGGAGIDTVEFSDQSESLNVNLTTGLASSTNTGGIHVWATPSFN